MALFALHGSICPTWLYLPHTALLIYIIKPPYLITSIVIQKYMLLDTKDDRLFYSSNYLYYINTCCKVGMSLPTEGFEPSTT